MPKSTWIFAGILSALVLLAVGWLQLRSQEQARARAEAIAAEAEITLAAAASTNTTLAADLQIALSRVAELEESVARAEQAQAGLETQMRGELESRDVTISELRGRLTVDILDRILFPSGEARLKPEGEAVLGKLARILAKFPSRAVQIIGHTDTVPIRSRTAEGFTDNWALSAGRAVSAVRFLTEQAGVDPRRLRKSPFASSVRAWRQTVNSRVTAGRRHFPPSAAPAASHCLQPCRKLWAGISARP